MFRVAELQADCRVGVYQRVNSAEAQALVKRGYFISSAFTMWKGEG